MFIFNSEKYFSALLLFALSLSQTYFSPIMVVFFLFNSLLNIINASHLKCSPYAIFSQHPRLYFFEDILQHNLLNILRTAKRFFFIFSTILFSMLSAVDFYIQDVNRLYKKSSSVTLKGDCVGPIDDIKQLNIQFFCGHFFIGL